MATDSFFNEMEPRVRRPVLSFLPEQHELMLQAQVSEPSLFKNDDTPMSFSESFVHPRAVLCQASPVKSPGFIPQLTPVSTVRKSRIPDGAQCLKSDIMSLNKCGCKPVIATNALPLPSSPSLDPEIRELMLNQSQQLHTLQKQVEQLLRYQEQLQDKSEEKGKLHESTQTSFCGNIFTNSPSRAEIPPKDKCHSPLRRPPHQDRTEITLTFRDLHMETILEQTQNSPQPSFLVNMQEYQESVSEQTPNSSEASSCISVMEQVQRLLAKANINGSGNEVEPFIESPKEKPRIPQNISDNPFRKVTVQRVQELGISFINPALMNVPKNPMYHPRSNLNHLWGEGRKETDQSVEMEQLAEKYLGNSKALEYNAVDRMRVRNQRSVEMSLSSQQYLERYGLKSDPDSIL